MIRSLKDSDDYLIKKVISIKVWEHNELAQDLANIKQTNFLDVHLGSSYLNDHGLSKRIREDIISVLGTEITDADLPEYDLRDLVRQILDKSKKIALIPR